MLKKKNEELRTTNRVIKTKTDLFVTFYVFTKSEASFYTVCSLSIHSLQV